MSLQKTYRRSSHPFRAGKQAHDKGANQKSPEPRYHHKKNGRDGFSHPAQSLSPVYGKVSNQALRPCVAAYSFRALGTIVRPATSTIGRPVPATTQSDEPFARSNTPQSFET